MINENPMRKCVDGERYEADVPDTLDLADRMALAINALTHTWVPEEKWALAFNVDYSHRPTSRRVNFRTDAYLNIPPKFIEALALCRLASGNSDAIDVDHEVLRAQLGFVGEDGLTYCPSDTLKGLAPDSAFGDYYSQVGASTRQKPSEESYSEIWGEGRLLIALSMLAQVDSDPRWAELAKRKVDRLLSLTREKDGYRFLWKGRFRPGETVPENAHEPDGTAEFGSLGDGHPVLSMMYSAGATGHGAGLLYRVTGYEPALELSRGLARWVLARMFNNPDGRYSFHHVHHGLYALMAVCEYGAAAEDREVLERVDACFRFAREMGDPLIGFFPEIQPGQEIYLGRHGNTVEICEVSDMVFLALYLTRAGIDDYWDDVDRWVRNVYIQGQVTNATFLDDIPESWFNTKPSDSQFVYTNDVDKTAVGSFLGWMRANDGITHRHTDDGPKVNGNCVMHCCTANGARTLYHVWDSIVTRQGDETRVNLLLNRASKWLDVDSYLPAEGKATLRIKDAPTVAVRMPEWVDPSEVHVTVDGNERRAVVDGRRLRLSLLRPGNTVTFTFPVSDRIVHRVLGEIPYKLTIRGSTVTEIDPKGVVYPLYKDAPTGKLVRKARFVPSIGDIVW